MIDYIGSPAPVQPTTLQIQMPQPETWRIFALRLGKEAYPGSGKLLFEGSFKDAHDFLDFVERIPMNTPGMEAVAQIQKPQPYVVRMVGPIVTLKLGNQKTCLGLEFNEP